MSDGYRLIELVAKGCSADVWKAEAVRGRHIAIKIYRDPVDSESVRTQLEGLKLTRSLRHPSLLPLHAYWSSEDRLMVALELAECSLWQRAVIADKGGSALPLGDLVKYSQQIAEALDFVHGQGIAHNAVTSDHILLCAGQAVLGSLGRARPLADKQGAFTDQNALANSYAELRLRRRPVTGSRSLTEVRSPSDRLSLGRQELNVLQRALSEDAAGCFPTCHEFGQALALAVNPDGPLVH